MAERNYTELINAAELQINNERNNPTMQNLLIDLHKGINHYKAKAEKYEAQLKQAEADMKEVRLGEDICLFCKNKVNEDVCAANDNECIECTAECPCKLCGFEEKNCNFQWRGRV